jgi:isopentenyldiphosphate isomerase
MSDPGDEMVDIVDDADRVIGIATRRAVRAQVLKHRCVSIVVRSSRREVLIHRRSERKDLWPGFWDLCAGGVLASGEDWDEGARRELAEELGVAGVLAAIGSATYRDEAVDEIARLYSVTHDGPFAFSDGEVAEAFFVTLDDLAARITRDRFVPDSIAVAWPRIRP